MKNSIRILSVIILLGVILTGCNTQNKHEKTTMVSEKVTTNKTNNITNNSNNASTQPKKTDSPKNIIVDKVPEAEAVPHQFYQYLNEKNYDKATSLFGPDLKFQGDPLMRKYLINLQHTDFLEFKDISSIDHNLTPSQQKYYAVKIYYAVLNIRVLDKNLVPGLEGKQSRRMLVVKVAKDSPWQLEADESAPLMN